jgi:hypothetical protein
LNRFSGLNIDYDTHFNKTFSDANGSETYTVPLRRVSNEEATTTDLRMMNSHGQKTRALSTGALSATSAKWTPPDAATYWAKQDSVYGSTQPANYQPQSHPRQYQHNKFNHQQQHHQQHLMQQQQQQQLQTMLATGQAQYVMIPGVGLVLAPLMQSPSMNSHVPHMSAAAPSSAYPQLGASQMNMYSGISSATSATRSSFKNSVMTLAAMAMQSADGLVYLVQFKHSQRNFILAAGAPGCVSLGEFVIVEADRGEDIGIVCEIAPASYFNKDKHTAGHRWKSFASGPNGEARKLIRIATLEERALLPDKAAEEAAVADACREKVEYQFQMPITVIDTEYQVDRHKLTIYYEAQK